MRKGCVGEKNGKNIKIMTFIVANNIVTSRAPKRRLLGPTSYDNFWTLGCQAAPLFACLQNADQLEGRPLVPISQHPMRSSIFACNKHFKQKNSFSPKKGGSEIFNEFVVALKNSETKKI